MTDCGLAAATYARGQSVVQYGPRLRHCLLSLGWTSIEDHERVTSPRLLLYVMTSRRKVTNSGETDRFTAVPAGSRSRPGPPAGPPRSRRGDPPDPSPATRGARQSQLSRRPP